MDTTKIEGYETMSAEEKVAALEAYEFDTSGWVSKATFDKAASDAADWKRKYNNTLSDAERQRQEDEEARKATETRLAELERKDKITTAKDQYIASDFDVVLAQETAEAFVDGKMDVVLTNIIKHATNVATAARDAALKETPAPPASGNGDPGAINYDKEIADALSANNMARAAYLTRLKSEQK